MVPDLQTAVPGQVKSREEAEEVKVEHQEQDRVATVFVLVVEQQLHIKREFHVIKCPVQNAEQEWSGSR